MRLVDVLDPDCIFGDSFFCITDGGRTILLFTNEKYHGDDDVDAITEWLKSLPLGSYVWRSLSIEEAAMSAAGLFEAIGVNIPEAAAQMLTQALAPKSDAPTEH